MRSGNAEDARTAYEIVVRGELSEQLSDELGARMLPSESGETLLRIEIIDQAHLHGVLERLHALNIPIESVNPVSASPARD